MSFLWKLDKDKKEGLLSDKEYKDIESKIMSISIKGNKVVCHIPFKKCVL